MNGRPHSVAVVIPLYNKAPWVGETLESVLNQSRQPDEIIVVDDGSTDEGPSIVKAMGGRRVTLIKTPTARSGPSAARNVGIHAARSEWIALLDADDLWFPDYLSRVAHCIGLEPSAGSVFASRLMVGVGSSFEHPPRQNDATARRLDLGKYLDLWIETGSKGLSPMHSSSSVIRKSILDKAGFFPERYRRGEDKDTWLRVAAAADTVHLPEPLVRYRHDLPGQLNEGPIQAPPPVVFTATGMARSTNLPPEIRAKLRRLANHELWLYAKRRRLRSLDKTALRTFHAGHDPIHFLMLAGLCALGAIGSAWRNLVRPFVHHNQARPASETSSSRRTQSS